MSEQSRSLVNNSPRSMTERELGIVESLIKKSSNGASLLHNLNARKVVEMSDGSMGSLKFLNLKDEIGERIFGSIGV